MHHVRRPLLAVILAAILLPGCKRDEDIVTYNAPKPPPSRTAATQEAAASASALTPQPAPEIPGLSYTTPTSWVPLKAHTFEAARFDPAAGDGKTFFTISPLGPAFDFATNVERWQKQVGMTPTPAEGQAGLAKAIMVSGTSAKAFELKGTTGESYIVVVERPDATWVFKLMGAADKVQTAKPAADAFLQSVKFGEAGRTAAAPPMPQVPPVAPSPAASSSADMPFTYTAPANWQLDSQPHPMREATWTVGTGPAKVEIYITEPIPANMFDIPSNVNRWRNQVGLPPDANISANPTSDVKIGDQQGVMIDLTGPAADAKPAKRMIVAFAGKEKLWFFKIIGPADAVGQQKAEFAKFLATVKFKPGA